MADLKALELAIRTTISLSPAAAGQAAQLFDGADYDLVRHISGNFDLAYLSG
jgi:hypothetical protein